MSRNVIVTYSRTLSPTVTRYTIRGNVLCIRDTMVDLGVTFGAVFNFNDRIDSFVKSTCKTLGFIITIRVLYYYISFADVGLFYS